MRSAVGAAYLQQRRRLTVCAADPTASRPGPDTRIGSLDARVVVLVPVLGGGTLMPLGHGISFPTFTPSRARRLLLPIYL